MAVKLVISDIDGTLVQHQPRLNDLAQADALIPQTAVDAVRRLHSNGIIVAGVTGRTYEQSKDVLSAVGITGPCVFAGGAVIRNLPDGKVLHETTLTEESIAIVQGIMSKYLASGRSIELNPSSLDPSKYNSIWAKLRIEDTDAVVEELKKVPDVYFVVNSGHGHNAEFGVAVLGKGADKGSATRKLLSILNVDRSEVVCVGDGTNDIPMFHECGVGIAMGNGAESLKEAADYVVAPIEQDGFKDAVDTILDINSRG